jgi:hypothetical protein
MVDGSMWKNPDGKLVIPPDDQIRQEIMKVWYDSLTAGHPEHDKTIRQVTYKYY